MDLMPISLIFYTIVGFACIQCKNVDVPPKTGSLFDVVSNNVTKSPVDSRIIGGVPAKLGEFRGMVELLLTIDHEMYHNHHCGGTLIHPELVVTAAHCIFGRDMHLIVIAGDSLSPSMDLRTQFRSAKKVHLHEKYRHRMPFPNDIALIFVDEPFQLTKTFGPMKISNADPVDNEPCHVAGWGLTDLNDGDSASIELRKVEIDVIPLGVCKNLELYKHISKGSFCAGALAGGRDSCQGDSGGPLICDDELKGIVSWGIGCGFTNQPGVYTNVYQYREWIIEHSDNLMDFLAWTCSTSRAHK